MCGAFPPGLLLFSAGSVAAYYAAWRSPKEEMWIQAMRNPILIRILRAILALVIAAAPALDAGDGASVDEKFDDGKYEYQYDDGRFKVEEKIDYRAGKYEYKYEGPDSKCEEKFDNGKYEHKCE
jgi:hypothetical protein